MPLSVAIWVGPDATAAYRDAIESVLASLRFPKLKQGTIWQDRYYVLARTSAYPVGSVTRVAGSTLPSFKDGQPNQGTFFLVHAPKAFYVVRGVFVSGGSTCDIAFSRRSFTFNCAALGLRWDREGRPIGASKQSGQEALGPHPATVASDGTVLFDPFFGSIPPKVDPWG